MQTKSPVRAERLRRHRAKRATTGSPRSRPVLVWAALDCPSGWAVPLEARPYVLGRMAVRVVRLPDPGDECVVVGLMTSQNGRKAHSRSTLYSPDGEVLALARATWVALSA